MTWEISHADDIGGREQQQDRVTVLSHTDLDSHLLIVADGMGGHVGGALAAQAVIDLAVATFPSADLANAHLFLEQLCLAAHQQIQQIAAQEQLSPGSTCVMLLLKGEEAYWLHVGDSRLYHVHQNRLVNQTCDHSVVQLMVADGKMNEEEAANSGMQNQIYNCLGGEKNPEPSIDASLVEKDDLFILSSDGFWGMIAIDEVIQRVSAIESLDVVTKGLVSDAKVLGGEVGDNICLIIARKLACQTKARPGFFKRLFFG